jgi:ankyrin repeat protein
MTRTTREELSRILVDRVANDAPFEWALPQIQTLLKEDPKLVETRSIHGDLPIHEACYCEGPIELFEFFYNLHPAGLHERGRYEFTPLHYACVSDGDSMDDVLPAFLQHIVTKAPELIRARDTNGCTPLHLATLALKDNYTFLGAVRVLAGICPEEIVGGEYESSPMPCPLEIALRVKHTEAVKIMATLFLRQITKLELGIRTIKLEVFLDKYCRDKHAIECLLDECPEYVQEMSNRGHHILHVVLSDHAPLDVIKLLVDRFPESVSLADSGGNRGLHIACKYKSASETIQFLAQACPASVNMRNNQGAIPLALACEADASLCDIFALMSLDPTLSLASF